jgi:hypothetical protein
LTRVRRKLLKDRHVEHERLKRIVRFAAEKAAVISSGRRTVCLGLARYVRARRGVKAEA